MNLDGNLILLSDGYKYTHGPLYPPKTEKIYSYFESRGGTYEKVLFFGLQYLLKKLENGISMANIDEAEDYINNYMPTKLFDRTGWERLLRKHQGRLPLEIKAVAEGTLVKNKNVLLTAENTDPEFFWLTNFFESLLLHVWYPTTVATQSFYIKQRILDYLEATGTPGDIGYKLHDFGFRGVSSVESAAIGGAAHLVNFQGTDTVIAMKLVNEIYHERRGCSIPASEHSTITSWGRDHELDAYRNLLDVYKSGLVACVSDSFDIGNAIRSYWGSELYNEVLQRQGVLVIRPDSGDPVSVVMDCLGNLHDCFGSSVNDKGYRVLNPHVRLIQGDGVDYQSIEAILAKMEQTGWSADNIAFGMGGALLQKIDRDTQKFAFKCSSATVDGEERDVYKDPATDHGKTSKMGRLCLLRNPEPFGYCTISPAILSKEDDCLKTVFKNGFITVDQSFDKIRERNSQEREKKPLKKPMTSGWTDK